MSADKGEVDFDALFGEYHRATPVTRHQHPASSLTHPIHAAKRLEEEGGVVGVTAKAKAKEVRREASSALGEAAGALGKVGDTLRPQISDAQQRARGLQVGGGLAS